MEQIVDSAPQGGSPVTMDQYGFTQFNLDPYYNYNSVPIPTIGPTPPPVFTIGPTPQPKKLTPQQARTWCSIAAQVMAGGVVSGGASLGSTDPSRDTPEQTMKVADPRPYFNDQRRPMVDQTLNENAGPVENWINIFAMAGTYASCVYSVSQ